MVNRMPSVRVRVNQSMLELVIGDITRQDVDALVNAANSSLLGGGGVDGAIHKAAGPELLAETMMLRGCKTGDAKITQGYHLKARHIIHAVGPVYRRNDQQVAQLLHSAYRRSLEVADENGVQTIAFPSISTGAYGYPIEEAAPIALKTVSDFLMSHPNIQLARFVLFTEMDFKVYKSVLDKIVKDNNSLGYTD
jgi:O-acetyl-ADP-ribose deacetylase (regulator of RNase III)